MNCNNVKKDPNSRAKFSPASLLLYGITERAYLNGRTLESAVEESLRGGVTCLQLRDKKLTDDELLPDALCLQKLCKKYDIPFIINDRISLAAKIDADGVHVGQSDTKASDVRKLIGSDKIMGVSAQNVEQALEAQKAGADYLGVGAVFPTKSKDDAVEVPHETLAAICASVNIPVVAIGGISLSNLCQLENTGIAGVALISAIFAQNDIEKSTREMRDKLNKLFG